MRKFLFVFLLGIFFQSNAYAKSSFVCQITKYGFIPLDGEKFPLVSLNIMGDEIFSADEHYVLIGKEKGTLIYLLDSKTAKIYIPDTYSKDSMMEIKMKLKNKDFPFTMKCLKI